MKKILCLALVGLMLFTFVGCGEDSSNNDDSWKNKTWDQMNGNEKHRYIEWQSRGRKAAA